MLRNITKKTIISEKIEIVNGISKTVGLLGKNKPKTIFFKTRFGIHTFFLKFPIDVIILDTKNRVIFLKKSLKPNRIFLWNIKFNKVIELPQESIDNSKTELGDILEF